MIGLGLPILSQVIRNITSKATGQERTLLQRIPLPPVLGEVDKVVGSTVQNMMRMVEKGPGGF